MKALVGFLRGPEAGELAHHPHPPLIPRRIHSLSVRFLIREPTILVVVKVGDVVRRVESVDIPVGDCGEPVLAFVVSDEDGVQRLVLPVVSSLANLR